MREQIHLPNLYELAEQDEDAGGKGKMKFEKTMRTIGIFMAAVTLAFILRYDLWAEPKPEAFRVCMADDQI